MSAQSTTPFSARHREAHRQIESDFPESARNNLLHLLNDLILRRYVGGWVAIARELLRIGGQAPTEFNENAVADVKRAKADAETSLNGLRWERVYDFCERLYTHLAVDIRDWDGDANVVSVPRSEVQAYIASELQRILAEEGLAYEFAAGEVRRRGRRHTEVEVARAQLVLGDPALAEARKHYQKALVFFREPTNPDFENAVKEAVCSVEAAARALFMSIQASSLGELLNRLRSRTDSQIPTTLLRSIEAIYGFRGSGRGVTHGGANGGQVTAAEAEYVLSVCASQIIYLNDVANVRDDVPF